MGMIPLRPLNNPVAEASKTKSALKDIDPPTPPYGALARNLADRIKEMQSELSDIILHSGPPERSKFKSAASNLDTAEKSLRSIKD